MGLLKDIRRDPALARELARCVEQNRPYRLVDLKLYLTRRCNLRCQMCNAWTEPKNRRDELSTEEVFRLIAQARPLGLANLKLFGGEPLLRQDVEAIVERAAGSGIRCTLVTNGTLLTEPRARRLVEAGLAELDLSLDAGDPELHDAIRGAPGAWRRTVDGMQRVQAAARTLGRRVVVRVNVVVMRQNYPDLPRLMDELTARAVDEITLNPVVPQGDNERGAPAEYVLSPQDILRYNDEIAPLILERAAAYPLARERDRVYIYGTDEGVAGAAPGGYVERLRLGHCFKPWYYMLVRENGDVLGCNTVKHPAARIGNVRETGLAELWFSEAYQAFRALCKSRQLAGCERCCYTLALLNRQIEQALDAVSRTL